MSLNFALVISGDASGAKKAVDETTASVKTLGGQAGAAQAALAGQSAEADRLAASLIQATAAETQIHNALTSVTGSARLTSSQFLNLTRQGNDVITMFALGASPMQIFASQAGQIVDALQSGPGGLQGSLKAIGEGALSLATRFPLATAALAAVTVAAGAYAIAGGNEIKSLDEILKEHEANIKRLGAAYEEAAGKEKVYAADTARTVAALNETSVQAIKDKLSAQTKEVFDNLYKQFGAGGGAQGALPAVLLSQFNPFRQAIDELAKGAKTGAPDIKAFRDEVTRLAATDPKNLDASRDKLLALTSAAADTAAALPNVAKGVDLVAAAQSKMLEALRGDANSGISRLSDEQGKYVEGLIKELISGKRSAEDFKSALASLDDVTPDFSGAISQVSGLADELERAQRAALGLADTTPRQDRLGYNRMDAAAAGYDQALSMWRRFGHDDDSKIDPNKPTVDRAAQRDANAYNNLIKSVQDRIAQMQVELALTGKVGAAASQVAIYQDLLSRATDHGRTITEAHRQELEEYAKTLAWLSDSPSGPRMIDFNWGMRP